MRAISRFFSALLLCAMLCSFCMWRNETLPDMSGIADTLKNAVIGEGSPLSNLLGQVGLSPDSDDNGVTDPYEDPETVIGTTESLAAAAISALEEKQTVIDISALDLSTSQVREEMEFFFLTHPRYFYVSTGYSLSSNPETDQAIKITLNYLYDIEDIPAMELAYEQALAAIIETAPKTGSDFDKALYLHDYLVQNFAYDYEGLREEERTGQSVAIRDTYNFFTQKVGVCQAYTLAFIALCAELEIESLPVTCTALNHVWNLVKLDGEWYHVDVTWDDAGGETSAVYPSYISYEYFLLSGEALYQGGRNVAWQATELARSKSYDSAVWHRTRTPMARQGELYYCTVYEESQIALYAGSATEMVKQASFAAGWGYSEAWAGLAVWQGDLVVSTASSFYLYDTESNAATLLEVMTPALGGKKMFGICGISDTGIIRFVAAADYRGEYEIRTWTVPS